ncbi:30063_t:CDS:2 [Racocetra persica]|uniref:30063_t:CDS:1 n=1 Tax=Racocetra persica TaxID=160502 RepID=A0ACA9MVH5_9GLOM|nr:30063_t:CDS:2 [Racocetra persica]
MSSDSSDSVPVVLNLATSSSENKYLHSLGSIFALITCQYASIVFVWYTFGCVEISLSSIIVNLFE